MVIRLAVALLLSTVALTAARAQQRYQTYLPVVVCAGLGVWLTGVWANEVVVYQFDVLEHTQTRTAFGITETRTITILDETDTEVTYHTGGEAVTVTRVDERTVHVRQAGRIPLTLTRQE